MDQQKLNFITEACIPLFKSLTAGAVGHWGKMNGQQAVEHVAAFFYVSSGKIKFELVTPVEHLPKFKEFLLSDKPFRENTRAPGNVIGEEPLPLRHGSMDESLQDLVASIADFNNYFKEHAGSKTLHPVFGELDYAEWVLLHYKHVTHHLRQFGLL